MSSDIHDALEPLAKSLGHLCNAVEKLTAEVEELKKDTTHIRRGMTPAAQDTAAIAAAGLGGGTGEQS